MSHRRLQLAVVRKTLEEAEGEKAHMDPPLNANEKDVVAEHTAREQEVQLYCLKEELASVKRQFANPSHEMVCAIIH